MPSVENVAVVFSALASVKLTVPGPLTFDQVVVSVAGGFGSPSSLALPLNDAPAGRVTVWSNPALTVGGWLVGAPGLTVTVTSSVFQRTPSLPTSRST